MKKTFILAAVVMITATAAYAQKINVRRAKNAALAETPDFATARAAIGEALNDSTTKNLTETWYVAGLIGYQQNNLELLKLQEGKGGTDYNLRGQAVMESYDYWLVADSMSQVPVYDKKGKAKYDTHTRRQIAEKMVEYYTHKELAQYAIDAFNAHDYTKSYEAFIRYINLPDLPMMQNPKLQEQMVRDNDYYLYKYYAGLAAYNSEQYDKAIALFQSMLDNEEKGTDAGKFLYQSYINLGDSASANKTLDDCITAFPAEIWFLENRINNLVNANRMDEAIAYLDHAIQNDPQVKYFILKGSIQTQLEQFDDAVATYQHALTIDDSSAELYENFALVYSTKGNKMNEDAMYLSSKEYAKAKKEIDKVFLESLPYFEKAYELAPDNGEYKRNLRQLYFRLDMLDKYNQLAD